MRVDEIFDLRYGHSLEFVRLPQVQAPAGVNFVGRAATNNGVTGRVVPPTGLALGQVGDLTVALNGQGGALASFVQPAEFVTGFHVMILTPKEADMSTPVRLWWSRCIWENHYRYGFGRQANRTLMSLNLPDDPPKWVLDADEPSLKKLHVSQFFDDVDIVSVRSAKALIRVEDLFNIRYGHSLELNRLTRVAAPLGVNFVGRSASNNGVTARVAVPDGVDPGAPGELTVALGGSVLSTFVQPEAFLCGRDGAILTAKDTSMSFGEKLWWAHCITQNQYRFNYGRQANRTLASIELPGKVPSYVPTVFTELAAAK